MKNLLACLLALPLVFGNAYNSIGQIINRAEYFINTDPGVGNGIAINVPDVANVDENITIPATGISQGFNQLFIRVRDQDSNWSIAEQRTFYIDNTLHTLAPSLASAEYFFDTDKGVGTGISLPAESGDSVNSLVNINTAGLADGFHQLFIRVKDQYNNWSISEQRTFYVDNTLHALAPSLTSAEYFFDTDKGVGTGISLPIKVGDTINILSNINTAGLVAGFHQLFIRVKNADSSWSIAEQRTFVIDSNLTAIPSPLVAAEYFIDVDSGVGKGTPVSIIKGDSVNTSYAYKVSNLSFGSHVMNVRVKDSLGYWSITDTAQFTVSSIDSTCAGTNLVFISGDHNVGNTYQWQVNTGNGFTNITNNTFYSGVTTDSLHLTNPPTSWYGYLYQCLVSNSGGSVIGLLSTLKFVDSWVGSSDSIWENKNNWSCGELPDANTDVLINSGLKNYPVITTNEACRSININPSATIKLNSGLNLYLTGKPPGN